MLKALVGKCCPYFAYIVRRNVNEDRQVLTAAREAELRPPFQITLSEMSFVAYPDRTVGRVRRMKTMEHEYGNLRLPVPHQAIGSAFSVDPCQQMILVTSWYLQ